MEKSFPVNTCLEVRDVGKRFGDRAVLAEIKFFTSGRRSPGDHRPERRRQIHSVQHHRRLADARQRCGHPVGEKISPAGRRTGAAGPGTAQTFQSPQIFPKMSVLENVMLGAWFGREPAPDETVSGRSPRVPRHGGAGRQRRPPGRETDPSRSSVCLNWPGPWPRSRDCCS